MILFNEEKTVTSEELLPKVTIEIKFTKTSNMNVLLPSFARLLQFYLTFVYYNVSILAAISTRVL